MRFENAEKQSSMHNCGARGGCGSIERRFRKGVTLLLLSLYKQSHNSREPKENGALSRFAPAARDVRMVGFVLQNKLGKHDPLPTPPPATQFDRHPVPTRHFYHRRPSGKKLSRDFHSLRPANALGSLSVPLCSCPPGRNVGSSRSG